MTVAADPWKLYFDAQTAIRTRYEAKMRVVRETYAALNANEPTADPLALLQRQGSLYAELDALQREREMKLGEMVMPA